MSSYLDEGLEDFRFVDGWPVPVVLRKAPIRMMTNPRVNRVCHICGSEVTQEDGFTCFACLDELADKAIDHKVLFGVEEEDDRPARVFEEGSDETEWSRRLREIVVKKIKELW